MPQGAPARKEKKKPKKDAVAKGVKSTVGGQSPVATSVEIVGKKRKQRDEE